MAEDEKTKHGEVLRLIDDASGVTAIEYALIAGLIALVIAAVLPTIGAELIVPFTTISQKL